MDINAYNDIKRAVTDRLGVALDDLRRAKAAFRMYSAEGMRELHGESGKTREEVLAGYEDEVERWGRALMELKERG